MLKSEEQEKLKTSFEHRFPGDSPAVPMIQEGAGAAIGNSERHPREQLLEDLNDQEQRLLDKLAALREIRKLYLYSTLAEAELLMKIARLADVLRYQ